MGIDRFHIDFVPVPWNKLTPKRARRWLREYHYETFELIHDALTHIPSDDPSHKEWVSMSFSANELLWTCHRIIDTGKPERLVRPRADWKAMQVYAELLRLPAFLDYTDSLQGGSMRTFVRLSEEAAILARQGGRLAEPSTETLN